MIRAAPKAIALALVLALQGCALAPEPKREDLSREVLAGGPIPEAWKANTAGAGEVESGWLEKFSDPELEALVAEALIHNANLQAASARVEKAAAYVKVAGGQLYPAVAVVGRAGANFSESGSDLQGLILSASWEIDLWGRVRYGIRSTKDQHAAVEADYAYARLSLAALVAKARFTLTEASLQRALLAEMLDAANKLVEFAENRARVGAGSEYDAASARANLQTYRDSLLRIDASRDQASRALELLVGRYPAAEIAAATRLPSLASSVPAGVPADLLERRPDVIAAERRVGAAFNLVQEAKAARLPTISLGASASHVTSDLIELDDRGSPVWRVGGKIFAPLFTGGALRAEVDVRTAEQKEAVAGYAQTALAAFGEVESALSTEATMQSREAVLTLAVADSAKVLELAQARYRVGSGDLRAVEEQQLSYQAARSSLVRVQTERRIQRINLHLALGGDYAAPSA